jgi:hypothetical protein
MKLPTPRIKLTTLIQAAAFMVLGGYIGAEYQTMKLAAAQSDTQVLQEAGFINMAVEKPLPRYIDQGVY